MPRIFISYKRADKDLVFPIKDKIEAALGKDECWIDINGIESDAKSWEDKVIHAINEASVFLFMYSKRIAAIKDDENDRTLDEFNFARSKNKRIVFINIDKAPLNDKYTFRFGQRQQIDASSEAAMNNLLKDINTWLQAPSPKPLPQSPSWYQKYKKQITTFLYVLLSLILLTGAYLIWGNVNSPNPSDDTICTPIDLGLTSGTLWGDRNIGSLHEEDYGNLYAWGETVPKEDYSWYTYVMDLKPSISLAGSHHNVATMTLGSEWTMPSEAQFNELISECKWYWESKNGHKGYKIVGRNGKYIFLPASGWSKDTTIEYRNQYGYYWTLERVSNSKYARSLQFPKNGKGIIGNGILHYGRSVRAVYHNDAVAE